MSNQQDISNYIDGMLTPMKHSNPTVRLTAYNTLVGFLEDEEMPQLEEYLPRIVPTLVDALKLEKVNMK